jgi:hypothetical protein
VLSFTGALQLWHLVIVAIIIGSLDTLFDPALQASLPALTDNAATLLSANGLMNITRRLASALGPSLAGVLVALFPLTHFFTLDAISFVISALAIFSLGTRFVWRPARSGGSLAGVRGIMGEVATALRLVRGHRPLAWAMQANGLSNFAWPGRLGLAPRC